MHATTPTRWSTTSVALHWIFALMVLAQVPLGFWLSREAPQARITGDDTLLLWLEQIHHSTGFFILLAAALRLSWRLSHPAPGLPPMAGYQKALAHLTHVTLYVLMFVFPLSGWAGSSLIGSEQFPVPINFVGFEMFGLEFLRALDPPFNTFRVYRDIHIYCWWVGGGVLSLHVLAALYHHFRLRDDVLRRMLPAFMAGHG
ncbi:MAG: cytochrome b [Rhodospirillaceae bacterium]|nr:cytochrome b [Rhodospirillaceae bacterium]